MRQLPRPPSWPPAARVNDIHTSPYTKEAPLSATLSVNQKITGRDSEKDVRHIEIDLGDSGLRYQPGDALGVWYQKRSSTGQRAGGAAVAEGRRAGNR